MRRRFVGLVSAGALLLAVSVGPVAAGQDTIGTPGDKNCEGQTTAFLAQIGHEFDVNGIAGFANILDLSVKELKAAIRAYCAGSES